jgi:hypothetical protein
MIFYRDKKELCLEKLQFYRTQTIISFVCGFLAESLMKEC